MFDGLSVASSGERVNNRKNAKQNSAINPGAQWGWQCALLRRGNTGNTPSNHSVEHFDGFFKVAAVNCVQCRASNPARAGWCHWPEFSSGESLCLRYTIAMKANCPLEASLLKFAFAAAIIFLSWLSQFCVFWLHANAASNLTTEPELLFPRFCPDLALAQPKGCQCCCSSWSHWKHHSQIRLTGDLAQD